MEAPDLQFMVHSADVEDEEGRSQRGSTLTPLAASAGEPPEWRLRDFAFAAYGRGDAAPGLREVHFGRRSVWLFASPREHCEEVAVFRRGSDTRRKWDGEAFHEPKVGLDRFFVLRMRQVTEATPLSKQFNGEWGFWESFFVPILDDEQTMEALASMSSSAREAHFAPRRLPVTCHRPAGGQAVLAIPDDLVVRYKVRVSCADVGVWGEFCNSIGEDMVLRFPCLFGQAQAPVRAGSEVVRASSEVDGLLEGARLRKRDLEALRLPVELVFECDMNVSAEWRPDRAYLQRKFEVLSQAYETNLMNSYSSLGRERPDPWHPMARLAVSALHQVLALYPDIRSVLDIGCGDMAWMQYFLRDHPKITYVGVDVLPFCLAVNFRRFPKMQFIQADVSNLSGIEVLPQGCDLVIAKDVFNQMVLPDAVDALRRVVSTRPRFLLTHIHTSADNSGWENRIHEHLEYTRYDYNKPPFSLPYPVMHVQRISDDAAYVLYQITPDRRPGVAAPPPKLVQELEVPRVTPEDLDSFLLIAEGEWAEPRELLAPAAAKLQGDVPMVAPDELGPRPAPVGREAQQGGAAEAAAEKKPIKGIPAAEFRARCDLIFEKFDKDRDGALSFEELVALMEAGGRKIEEYDAYAALCKRLGCDARVGLSRKDVYKLFEKAPLEVWEEVYRSINPLAQMVKRGADRLPETFLERPLPNFFLDDTEGVAKVVIEPNEHMFFGAAEVVTPQHVQAFFGKQRLEVHIVAPGSYGAKDLFVWKLIVTPLTGEIVPEDCSLEVKDTGDRAGIKGCKVVVKLTKSKRRKWGKVGQAVTGQRI